jgi:hypothetical protein
MQCWVLKKEKFPSLLGTAEASSEELLACVKSFEDIKRMVPTSWNNAYVFRSQGIQKAGFCVQLPVTTKYP